MRKRAKKMMNTEQVPTETQTDADEAMTGSGAPEAEVVACNYPAPAVVNGAAYCGCQLPRDHEGVHEVKLTWVR